MRTWRSLPRWTKPRGPRSNAIVLARGGGSEKDLFVFNLEPVVRAIVRAKRPVLTAIGHTSNHHLCDEVADLAFGTPSLAAEYIAKGWLVASRRLSVAIRDLARSARDIVLRASQRCESGSGAVERATLRILAAKLADLAGRTARLERRNPQRTLADVRARLAASSGRLDTAAARLVSRKAHASGERGAALERGITALRTSFVRRLERAQAELDRFDPLAPLAARVRNRHQGWARRARRRANSHRRLGRGAPGARDARSPRGIGLGPWLTHSLRRFEAKLARIDAIVKELEGGTVELAARDRTLQRRKDAHARMRSAAQGCAGANRSRQSRRAAGIGFGIACARRFGWMRPSRREPG